MGYVSPKTNITLSMLATNAEKCPGRGITGVPHIESRVRHFRKKFGALEVMISKSGFTWDGNRKMIQCEKAQYEEHCKVDHFNH